MATDLSSRQMAICIGYGVLVWLLAALLLRQAGLAGGFEGWRRAALFAAIVPGSVPVVLILRRIARLGPGQLLGGMAIGTGAAVLLDAIALSWAPGLYGGVGVVGGAGATILWGAGVLIFLGRALDRPGPG